MSGGGLSEGTRAWLAGAPQRRGQPVAVDRPEDVQARLDAAASKPPAVTLPPHPEGEYVALEVALRDQVGDEDEALSVVQVTLAAGWRPPGEIAALVAAAQADTARRIAAAIRVAAATATQGLGRDDLDRGRVAGLGEAARIAGNSR